MKGTITGRDVVLHPLGIVRAFGVATYLSCLRAAISGKPRTFLGVLYPAPRSRAAGAADVAARPGAIVLAAAVSRCVTDSPTLGPVPTGGPRWRLSR